MTDKIMEFLNKQSLDSLEMLRSFCENLIESKLALCEDIGNLAGIPPSWIASLRYKNIGENSVVDFLTTIEPGASQLKIFLKKMNDLGAGYEGNKVVGVFIKIDDQPFALVDGGGYGREKYSVLFSDGRYAEEPYYASSGRGPHKRYVKLTRRNMNMTELGHQLPTDKRWDVWVITVDPNRLAKRAQRYDAKTGIDGDITQIKKTAGDKFLKSKTDDALETLRAQIDSLLDTTLHNVQSGNYSQTTTGYNEINNNMRRLTELVHELNNIGYSIRNLDQLTDTDIFDKKRSFTGRYTYLRDKIADIKARAKEIN